MRLSDWNLCLTYLASTLCCCYLRASHGKNTVTYFQIAYETEVKFWKKVSWLVAGFTRILCRFYEDFSQYK